MRTIRLLVAYDGTEFHGWQIQPGRRTVQGVMEEALRDMLEHEDPPRVSGAGRTDAGTHARGQVASFGCESRLPARAIAPLLNRRLPADVRVRAATDVPPEFHARHSARSRRYAYRVLEQDDVLMERFAWRVRGVHDWEGVDAATRALERRADFRAFAAAGSPSSSTICHVHLARWRRLQGGLRFDIVADRFLYHMVRNIVGTALRVAPAPDPAAAMLEVLESGERARAGATVPAHGLCLERVGYDDPEGT